MSPIGVTSNIFGRRAVDWEVVDVLTGFSNPYSK